MTKEKITEEQAEAMYNDMLDETYEPFMGQYAPSIVLEEVDPIAYRVGFSDYVDSISDEYEVEGYND